MRERALQLGVVEGAAAVLLELGRGRVNGHSGIHSSSRSCSSV
jgi:hypothetical protein